MRTEIAPSPGSLADHPGAEVAKRPGGGLGVQVSGVRAQDLGAPDFDALREIVWRHRMLVLLDQELSEADYIRFASGLGTIRPYFQENYRHPEHPEIFVSSNLHTRGERVGVPGTGRMWHSDYSFFPDPVSMTTITPRVLPDARRETLFVDMVRACAELPAHLREALEGRRCYHDPTSYYKIRPEDVDKAICEVIAEFHASAPRTWHPAFLTHPVTGERALFVSGGFTTRVEGLSHEECGALLSELFAFLEDPARVHSVEHVPGAVLLWDNRAVVHHASSVTTDQPNQSYRISLDDGRPFFG
jgi:taurine dioxygenase